MKKYLSVLCALTLLLGMFAFPASAAEVDLSKPMEIELMAYYVMDIPEDDPIMVYLEDKFNVDFKLTITNIDNYNDTLNMRIASGDIPDWFRIRTDSVYRTLAEDGVLLGLDEYVEKYNFENIRKTFELNNAKLLRVDDVFYCVPDTAGKLVGGIYYRADWLEELGLEPPKTFDELKTCLQKIVEADPDGMGTTGFTTYGTGWLEQCLPAFVGFFDWGVKEDGSLIFEYEHEGYKDYLKFWADLYAEKLLDQEIYINSYETCMEKLASGRTGFYIMNMNTTWWSNNKAGLSQFDPEAKLGALYPYPEGPAGALNGANMGFSASSSFNADMDEEKAARMLAIMDYLLSEEGRELTLYGYEEGMYYDTVDGVKVQKEDVVNKAWGQQLHFMGEIADFGTGDRLARDPELVGWNEHLDSDLIRHNKLRYFANDEATKLKAEINEVCTQYNTAFLTGEMDIEEKWDEFQQKMKDAGLDKYRDLLQQYAIENGIELDKAY